MLKEKGFPLYLMLIILLFNTFLCTPCFAKKFEDSETLRVSECNDGLDNDGDGFVDYAFDMGCYGPSDSSELAKKRSVESGWTTIDRSRANTIYYVSSQGSDYNSGLSPETPLATFAKVKSLITNKNSPWILFKRGDTFDFGLNLTGIHGESSENPVLISAYGKSHLRPLFYGKISAVKSASNINIIGLHSKVNKPTIESQHTSGLRFVGSFENILIEDNRFDFGQVTLQKFGEKANLNNIAIRRNLILNSFSMNSHSQGLFVSGASNLLIKENFFDHNGWLIQSQTKGRGQENGQATIYNHNIYINGSSDIIIEGNLIFRAASMGIKMRSDTQGLSRNISIKNNVFYEGEIGIGIGGNTSEKFRFVDANIERNAFLSIGKSRPTSRNISWPVAAKDVRGLVVSDNIFAHQEMHKGSFALKLSNSIENAKVQNNIVYGVDETGFVLRIDNWKNVSVSGNIIHDSKHSNAQGIKIHGDPEGIHFSNNQTALWRNKDSWIKEILAVISGLSKNHTNYTEYTGDGVKTIEVVNFASPHRNLQSYFSQYRDFNDDNALMEIIASHRSRSKWNEDYSADSILKYIYNGFKITEKENKVTAK